MRIRPSLNFVLVSATVIAFAVSAAFSLNKINRVSVAVSEQYPLTVWQLDQMELEYRTLTHTLDLYAAGKVDKTQLLIDFDILWNRSDVVINGKDNHIARSVFGADDVAVEVLKTLQRFDAEIQRVPETGNWDVIGEFRIALAAHKNRLHDLHARSFHERESVWGLSRLERTLNAATLAFIGLFASGLLLIVMLVAQFLKSKHMAHHDELTRLANRRFYMDQLQQHLLRASRYDQQLAIYSIDMDRFKEINDSKGHLAGDRVLEEVGKRLRSVTRRTDLAARLGGDEFSLIQFPVDSEQDVEALRARIVESLSKPIRFAGTDLHVGFSIGVAVYPADGATAEQLIQHADIQMYAEKAVHHGEACAAGI